MTEGTPFIILSPNESDEAILSFFRAGFDIVISRPLSTSLESARAPQDEVESLTESEIVEITQILFRIGNIKLSKKFHRITNNINKALE